MSSKKKKKQAMQVKQTLHARFACHMGAVALAMIAALLPMAVEFSIDFTTEDVHAAATVVPKGSSTNRVRMTPATLQSQGADFRAALEERKELLSRRITVAFVPSTKTDTVLDEVLFVVRETPSWVQFDVTGKAPRARISPVRIRQHLETNFRSQKIPVPRSCAIISTSSDEQNVLRAETDCIAQVGYEFDTLESSKVIAQAIESGEERVTVELTEISPTITDPSTGARLTLLATGRSAFNGSGVGRKANVRKALNERLHNVVVPEGALFSFTDTLGDKVTTSRGWQMALTIFEGENLRLASGGGICQASTTLYRAALRAGLPIVEQKNHSLYVVYYEKYAVGLDATVFPKQQDLQFKNDTRGLLIVQSFTEGDEAFVNIYGIDDGRAVTMTGPYFGTTAPKDLLVKGKKVRNNEVVWIRKLLFADGAEKEEILLSRYKSVPQSLAKKWSAVTEIVRGFAPDGEPVVLTD